jgi:glycosyltransferase involved in cell wall biosynthesis
LNPPFIDIVYQTRPDRNGGTGGVREFLAGFSSFLSSQGIKWEYRTLFKGTPSSGLLSPLIHLFLMIRLILKLIIGSPAKGARVLYAHDAFFSGMAACIAGHILKVPVLLHCHNLPSTLYRMLGARLGSCVSAYSHLLRITEKAVLTRSDIIIVTNSAIEKRVVRYGISEKRVYRLPMAVNTGKFRPSEDTRRTVRAELGIMEHKFVVGTVARLTRIKNVDALLKAFYLFQLNYPGKGRLLVVGDGPEMHSIEESIEELGLSGRAILTGFRTDVFRLLQAMDLFVLSSFSEGSSISVLEAMASATVVAASRIPAIEDIADDKKHALLFDPRDSTGLYDAIRTLYKDRSLMNLLVYNAHREALKHDCSNLHSRILSLCRDLAVAY